MCVHAAQGAALALVAEESEDKDKGVIESLLNFKDHWDALVGAGFHGNDAFVTSVKSALEAAVNSRDNKPSELVGMCDGARVRLIAWQQNRCQLVCACVVLTCSQVCGCQDARGCEGRR